jgi:hypothetical protein
MLLQEMQTGRFVVRESQTCPGTYTLSVLVDGQVRHVRVRDAPRGASGGLCLRENATDREIFSSLVELIECYAVCKLQLRDSIPFYLVPQATDLSEA